MPIQRLHLDRDQEHRRRRRRPLHVDDPFGLILQRGGIRAVRAVHADAAAAGDEAHDVVAGHRGAALGQLGQHTWGTGDGDADVVAAALTHRHRCRRGPLGQFVGRVVVTTDLGDQSLHHVPGRDVPLAYRGVERRDVGVAQFAGERANGLGSHQALQRKSAAAHLSRDRVLTRLQRLFSPFLGEPLSDLGLGARRDHEGLPVARRSGVGRLRGEDLDHFAVFQLAFQRDESAVDPRTDAAVSDLGVHRVGEVDRCRPGRQRDHVTLGGEHEDLLHREVVAQRLEELTGVGGLPLPVQQLTHPGHVVDLGRRVAGRGGVASLGLLVPPVRGDAVFGGLVHVEGADLHLQRLAFRTHHRGVQRLVHPEAGLGDVVLETPGDGLPQRMHHPDRGVTVAHLVAQDAHADQVVDVVEVAALDDHLLIDRPVVLGPAFDDGTDLRRRQSRVDLGAHLGQVGVARRGPVGDQPHDLLVLLRMQDRERQILELPLDGGHTQPMRQRGNDFECFAGFAGLLLRRQEAHGPHVVQPVGHLDHQHAWVARHRDDHLADRLAFGGGTEGDLVQLGDPVDEVADLGAELLGQRLQRVAGVLDGVVQQCRHERRGVHAELGQDVGHRQRMGDVGITGLAHLVGVALLGDVVGLLQQRQVCLRIDLPVYRDQRLENRVDGAALRRHPSGQPGPHPPRRAGGGLGQVHGLGFGSRRTAPGW